jgi:hypothetical protein
VRCRKLRGVILPEQVGRHLEGERRLRGIVDGDRVVDHWKSTSAVQPWAAAMPSASRRVSAISVSTDACDSVRTVAPSRAAGGITLTACPAESCVTVTTTGSNTENRRVTIVCSASPISNSAGTGSTEVTGWEP